MTLQNIVTWVLLMALTILAGLVSIATLNFVVPIVLILAVLKFIGVSFNFMEIKEANLLWKILIVVYLIIFIGIILAVF